MRCRFQANILEGCAGLRPILYGFGEDRWNKYSHGLEHDVLRRTPCFVLEVVPKSSPVVVAPQ